MKSFPSHVGPLVPTDLRFINPQLDTILHRGTMDTELVHYVVWLFTPQLSLVFVVPTHRGIARLS